MSTRDILTHPPERMNLVEELPPQKIFEFITSDFETMWNGVATQPTPANGHGRGNFPFSLLGMVFLEWSCRLLAASPLMPELAKELRARNDRYFTAIPGECKTPQDFDLPGTAAAGKTPLLWLIFDLVRHGQAHQYQEFMVQMKDAKLDIDMTGAKEGRTLNKARGVEPENHLAYKRDSDGDLRILFRPELFYLDLKESVERIFSRNPWPTSFPTAGPRGKTKSVFAKGSSEAVKDALRDAEHRTFT